MTSTADVTQWESFVDELERGEFEDGLLDYDFYLNLRDALAAERGTMADSLWRRVEAADKRFAALTEPYRHATQDWRLRVPISAPAELLDDLAEGGFVRESPDG